jgi:hypothetical protein
MLAPHVVDANVQPENYVDQIWPEGSPRHSAHLIANS